MREDFERNNSDVKMYLNNFEESTLVVLESEEESPYGAKTHTEKIAWNPLTKYKVIQRFREYIQPWVRNINNFDEDSLHKRISSYLESVYNISNGPDQEDYDAATTSIIEIQYVYKLATKDIASGFLHEQVSDALAQAKLSHDEEFSARKWDNTKYFPRRFAPMPEPDGTQKILGDVTPQQDCLRPPEVYYITKDTHGICQGKMYPTPDETKKLFCWISGLKVPESSGILYDLRVSSHTAGDYYSAHTDTIAHPTAL
ncbi:unnamed protein product, partial [Allacma fusca]